MRIGAVWWGRRWSTCGNQHDEVDVGAGPCSCGRTRPADAREDTMQLLPTRLGRPGQDSLRWLGWVAVIGLVLVALLIPASPALSNDTPGNNGTVKIHEDDTENEPGEVRNEPHVCTFHLHFYFSEPEQDGTWELHEW